MPDSHLSQNEASPDRCPDCGLFTDWHTHDCPRSPDAQSETSAEDRYLGGLKLIDVMLTTVEQDNVPRGEACKHSARLLARQLIGWRCANQTAAEREELKRAIGQAIHGYACGCERPWPTNANYDEMAEAVLAALIGGGF